MYLYIFRWVFLEEIWKLQCRLLYLDHLDNWLTKITFSLRWAFELVQRDENKNFKEKLI